MSLQEIGIVAAIVTSLSSLGLSIYNLVRTRTKRKVVAEHGVVTSPSQQEYLVVTFVNEQGDPVTIQEVGLKLANNKKIFYEPQLQSLGRLVKDTSLPVKVAVGENAQWYIDPAWLKPLIKFSGGRPSHAYCRDASGNYYRTPLPPTIVDWLMGEKLQLPSTQQGARG